MVKAGYTSVAEFHYVHNQVGGVAYADPAAMSRELIAAAGSAGIGLTLLPVLYGQGGFGGTPVGPAQRRFQSDPDAFAVLVAALAKAVAGNPDQALGIAPHSLRAVAPEHLDLALETVPATAPVHIHVAEQTREVEDCLVWSGQRPVRYLLDRFPVDDRWCLVHATHVEPDEVADMAARGAIAGLCPTTEADLGDGLFPVGAFLDRGGRFGVGSDSQVTIDPVAELRLLEWGQRLTLRKRGVLGGHRVPSVGGRLLRTALEGGAGACGRPIGRIAAGCRADLVVLDPEQSLLWDKRGDDIADAWVFGGGPAMVRDVWVGGRQVVAEGRHAAEDAATSGWRTAMAALTT
jgi:formimidoylglutamate deiminase